MFHMRTLDSGDATASSRHDSKAEELSRTREKRSDGFCGNIGIVLHNGQNDIPFYLGIPCLAQTDMHFSSGLPAETVTSSDMGWNEPVPNQPIYELNP